MAVFPATIPADDSAVRFGLQQVFRQTITNQFPPTVFNVYFYVFHSTQHRRKHLLWRLNPVSRQNDVINCLYIFDLWIFP